MTEATGPRAERADRSGGPGGAKIFVALDGMRGVAALAVVLWHAEVLTGFRPLSGYLAVDLFFVLSGFVIAHSYEARLDGGMTVRDFMRVRLIRLYPLFFAGVALATAAQFAAILIGAGTNWSTSMVAISFLLSLFYIPTPEALGSNHALFPLNPPAWSLFFELLINLLYVLFYRWLGLRMLIFVAAAGALALVLLTKEYQSLNTGFLWATALGGLPRVTFSFAAGVILLRLFRSGRLSLDVGALAPIVLTLAILCYGPPEEWRAVYDLFAALVVFPLLTLAGASHQPMRAAGIYRTLGLTSYAMYTLHLPLLAIAVAGLTKVLRMDLAAAAPWPGVLFAVAVFLVSWLAATVYDVPARRGLTRWLVGRRIVPARVREK